MIVSVKKLTKGMIIDSDIFSKKGALLLYKGFKIENPDLVAVVLTRNGINELVIKDQEDATDVPVAKVVESDEIKRKIESEIREFRADFDKVISEMQVDVDNFRNSNDLSDIKDLDRGMEIAKEYQDSVLTLFQLVEKMKAESDHEYSNMIENSLLAYSLGKWLEKTEQELKEICEASLLASILEYTGFDFHDTNLGQLKGKESVPKKVLEAALAAQERTDGTGPKGLKREEIPAYANVISVVDVYQALTRGTELVEKVSVFEAIRIMETEYITKLDVKTLYIFLHKIGAKFIGSSVKLSDGTIGEVVFVPENEISMPYLKLSDGHIVNLQNQEYRKKPIIEIF